MRNLVAVIAVILVAILGALYLSGCESQTQVQTTSFSASAEEASDLILAEEGCGNKVRVIFITGDKGPLGTRGYDLREPEVRAELERIVNSGEYDIITVKTIYNSGHLISVEVWHRVQQE